MKYYIEILARNERTKIQFNRVFQVIHRLVDTKMD